MSRLPSVDLITPCRNRVEYLRKSLPSWLACPQLQRIIVVDFNSTTPVIDSLGDLNGERVTVVQVEEEPLWRQGRAQNIGLGLAASDLVLKIDADVATMDIRPYVERMAEEPGIFFKGFSKRGTSSGLCLAPRRRMKAVGGFHDHMSGWGGDDVDFYQRLRKRKLKPQIFKAESFREQDQKMSSKNSEAPRLDSEIIADPQQLAKQPFFSDFRNKLLARIQCQNKRVALRWRFTPRSDRPNLVHAKLTRSNFWRLKSARHSIELANILAIAYYQKVESVWALMNTDQFEGFLNQHQLPPCRNSFDYNGLVATLPQRRQSLCELACALGVELQDAEIANKS